MVGFSGATPVPYHLEEDRAFSFDPTAVLRRVSERTRLIILNSPANPTGGLVGRAELDALVEGLADYPDLYVLSDEIYSRIVFGDHSHVSSYNFV